MVFICIISLGQIEVQQIAERIIGEEGHAAVVYAGAGDFIGTPIRIYAGNSPVGLGDEYGLRCLAAAGGNCYAGLRIPTHGQAQSLGYGADRKKDGSVFSGLGGLFNCLPADGNASILGERDISAVLIGERQNSLGLAAAVGPDQDTCLLYTSRCV